MHCIVNVEVVPAVFTAGKADEEGVVVIEILLMTVNSTVTD